MTTPDVLMIGAGLGGLACARDLARAGLQVRVLDKSRGVSGRAATRRTEHAALDHGAPYFTARSERLARLADGWTREGWLRAWTHGFPTWQDGHVTPADDGHARYAPTRGMSALGRHMAADLNVTTETHVTTITRTASGWRALTPGGDVCEARTLLLNLPAPQLATLLESVPLGDAGGPLDAVQFEPVWALLVPLREDVRADWPALRTDHPAVTWVAREHTKRAPGAPPALVAHASPDWTRAHLNAPREEVAYALLQVVQGITGPLAVQDVSAHLWRYARPTRRFPHPHGWDAGLRLGWCGDWCTPDPHGPRVEAALLSGWSLAGAVQDTPAPNL
ncbi:NAD(P)/FAD-dependent oxidoreductase [Deinococcus maricopensis]|uniref:Fumarate reductase/succinate dehydrogenase flavoprotein domain protein n=1 Tax=Deinococcus maricopensis (strain DSM 21211 / LMG 22137 / NRRL B-23946 / LB-34) TaxID=709986 RepID=E8U4N1_DEIML|nr:FAD-dependent oxidoreductase [Deinococcus maricopensis]ADV68896.1 fumarate reductase/succinate dehydrogenase flavoprotein domain protein [Deinococcus maricopensis DSM 21211]